MSGSSNWSRAPRSSFVRRRPSAVIQGRDENINVSIFNWFENLLITDSRLGFNAFISRVKKDKMGHCQDLHCTLTASRVST